MIRQKCKGPPGSDTLDTERVEFKESYISRNILADERFPDLITGDN